VYQNSWVFPGILGNTPRSATGWDCCRYWETDVVTLLKKNTSGAECFPTSALRKVQHIRTIFILHCIPTTTTGLKLCDLEIKTCRYHQIPDGQKISLLCLCLCALNVRVDRSPVAPMPEEWGLLRRDRAYTRLVMQETYQQDAFQLASSQRSGLTVWVTNSDYFESN